jgi:hypothetical protein
MLGRGVRTACFGRVVQRNPEVGLERQRHVFQHACERLGLVLPENVDALIVLDGRSTMS